MARKFIDLEEAAKMLGVSPETLTEMRERQKIYGYRDGGSWKFKPEDVEKLIADRDAADDEGEFAELDEDPDSILLSEVELGQSDESTSSTIIGGKPSRDPFAERHSSWPSRSTTATSISTRRSSATQPAARTCWGRTRPSSRRARASARCSTSWTRSTWKWPAPPTAASTIGRDRRPQRPAVRLAT